MLNTDEKILIDSEEATSSSSRFDRLDSFNSFFRTFMMSIVYIYSEAEVHIYCMRVESCASYECLGTRSYYESVLNAQVFMMSVELSAH